MKFLGYATAFVLTIVFSALWSGYVLSVLWGWFMVPAFGLSKLSIPLAIGLSLIVGYMTHQIDNKNDGRSAAEMLINGALTIFLKPTFALLMGWVVRFYV